MNKKLKAAEQAVFARLLVNEQQAHMAVLERMAELVGTLPEVEEPGIELMLRVSRLSREEQKEYFELMNRVMLRHYVKQSRPQ